MSEKIRVAVACDPGGFPLKGPVVDQLSTHPEIEIIDYGMEDADHPIMYYEQADKACRALVESRADRAVLICGTAQGMAIVANKFKGVYAGVVTDVASAKAIRRVNNANVMTLGGLVTEPQVAKDAVEAWLATGFTEGAGDRTEIIRTNFGQVQRIEEERCK